MQQRSRSASGVGRAATLASAASSAGGRASAAEICTHRSCGSRCPSARLHGPKARIAAQEESHWQGTSRRTIEGFPRSPLTGAQPWPKCSTLGHSPSKAAAAEATAMMTWQDAASHSATRDAGLVAAVQTEIQGMEEELERRLEGFARHIEGSIRSLAESQEARLDAVERSVRAQHASRSHLPNPNLDAAASAAASMEGRPQLLEETFGGAESSSNTKHMEEQCRRLAGLEASLKEQLAELAGHFQQLSSGDDADEARMLSLQKSVEQCMEQLRVESEARKVADSVMRDIDSRLQGLEETRVRGTSTVRLRSVSPGDATSRTPRTPRMVSEEVARTNLSDTVAELQQQVSRDRATHAAALEVQQQACSHLREELRDRFFHWSSEQLPLLQVDVEQMVSKQIEEMVTKQCEATLEKERSSQTVKGQEELSCYANDLENRVCESMQSRVRVFEESLQASLQSRAQEMSGSTFRETKAAVRDLQERIVALELDLCALTKKPGDETSTWAKACEESLRSFLDRELRSMAAQVRSEQHQVVFNLSSRLQTFEDEFKVQMQQCNASIGNLNGQLRDEIRRTREDNEAGSEALHGLIRESRRELEKVQQVLDVSQLVEDLTTTTGNASSPRANTKQRKKEHDENEQQLASLNRLEAKLAKEIKELPVEPAQIIRSCFRERKSVSPRRSQANTSAIERRCQLLEAALTDLKKKMEEEFARALTIEEIAAVRELLASALSTRHRSQTQSSRNILLLPPQQQQQQQPPQSVAGEQLQLQEDVGKLAREQAQLAGIVKEHSDLQGMACREFHDGIARERSAREVAQTDLQSSLHDLQTHVHHLTAKVDRFGDLDPEEVTNRLLGSVLEVQIDERDEDMRHDLAEVWKVVGRLSELSGAEADAAGCSPTPGEERRRRRSAGDAMPTANTAQCATWPPSTVAASKATCTARQHGGDIAASGIAQEQWQRNVATVPVSGISSGTPPRTIGVQRTGYLG